jgi:hypothetical protein
MLIYNQRSDSLQIMKNLSGCISCLGTLEQYMKSLRVGQMTKLPVEPKRQYTPLRGNMVKTWLSSSGGHTFAAVRVLLTQAPQSHRVSPGIEASRRVRIPSLPAEPLVLVLWLNQVTRRFCGEPSQTPRVDCGRELLPCTGSCP